MRTLALAATITLATAAGLALADDDGPASTKPTAAPIVPRTILVELFASQG